MDRWSWIITVLGSSWFYLIDQYDMFFKHAKHWYLKQQKWGRVHFWTEIGSSCRTDMDTISSNLIAEETPSMIVNSGWYNGQSIAVTPFDGLTNQVWKFHELSINSIQLGLGRVGSSFRKTQGQTRITWSLWDLPAWTLQCCRGGLNTFSEAVWSTKEH